MKKYILAMVIMMAMIGNAIAVSDEASTGATVTVNEFVSITLSDPEGDVEVAFGALNPGTNNNPDLEQTNSSAAITVTNDPVSNVAVYIDVKGTDFSDGINTIAVSQVSYDDDNSADEVAETGQAESTLATSYPETSYYSGVSPGSLIGFWFFLDVPGGQTASAGYQSTLSFRGTT